MSHTTTRMLLLSAAAACASTTPSRTPARKPNAQPEFEEQKALFEWARNRAVLTKHPELQLLSASLNGVKLSKATAGKAKAAGMLAGEWDVRLPVARGGFIGLIVEMKAGKNGLTDAQKLYRKGMEFEGHRTAVCYSWIEAKAEIEGYLAMARTLRG